MISRLLELNIQNFRVFEGEHRVPLDAGIVLIHGANGSGKSSLLSALEFAITEKVPDLEKFATDYPRCLVHIDAAKKDKRASVELTYRTARGDKADSCVTISKDGKLSRTGTSLPPAQQHFYVERCYLSQIRLSQLLDIYQTADSASSHGEQPLVRFIRELLGLDLLENLTVGLHTVGHIARIREEASGLERLEEDEEELRLEETTLKAIARPLEAEFERHIQSLRNICKGDADPLPGIKLDLIGINKRLEAISSKQVDRKERTLEKWKQELAVLKDGFSSVSMGEKERPYNVREVEVLRIRLTKIDQELQALTRKLSPVLRDVRKAIHGRSTEVPFPAEQLEVEYDAFRQEIATILAKLEMERKATEKAAKDLESYQKQLNEIDSHLKFAGDDGADVSERQRWAETLSKVRERLVDNICPVCSRDYSEAKRGSLREHINDELKKLGAELRQIEKQILQRDELKAKREALVRQMTGLVTFSKSGERSLKNIANKYALLQRLLAQLNALTSDIRQVRKLRKERAELRSQLVDAKLHEKEKGTLLKRLVQLSVEIGLKKEELPKTPNKIIATIESTLTAETKQHEAHRTRVLKLTQQLEETLKLGQRLKEDVHDKQARINQKKEQIEIARQNFEEVRVKAQQLVKAAAVTKGKLLNQVFSNELSDLWDEIFRRLARSETFRPKLGESTPERGRLIATLQGIAEGTPAFRHIGAVLSSGNVNTAALSLFLALNLIERPNMPLLVLDDPVQNMDDIHLVQLAGVLRTVTRQAGRQLIVAVHERALFEYLTLELGPTTQSERLVAIDLSRRRRTAEIQYETHEWVPDAVKFGT